MAFTSIFHSNSCKVEHNKKTEHRNILMHAQYITLQNLNPQLKQHKRDWNGHPREEWITLSTNVSQNIRINQFQKQYRRKNGFYFLSPSLLDGSAGRRKRFEYQQCATYLDVQNHTNIFNNIVPIEWEMTLVFPPLASLPPIFRLLHKFAEIPLRDHFSFQIVHNRVQFRKLWNLFILEITTCT